MSGAPKVARPPVALHSMERSGPELLRLTAVDDGLHLAAANSHDRPKLARAAFVQPLFGIEAGHGKACIRLGHHVESAAVVDRSTVGVAQGGLTALVDHREARVSLGRDSVLAPQ